MKLRYGQAHSDWVCQVGWTGPAHYIISAAQSPSPSLLIQHVSAHRKQYIFTLRMVERDYIMVELSSYIHTFCKDIRGIKTHLYKQDLSLILPYCALYHQKTNTKLYIENSFFCLFMIRGVLLLCFLRE